MIAGGILAAALGAAGILATVVTSWLVLYLFPPAILSLMTLSQRRCRRSEGEALSEEVWNRTDARRQSAILTDELGPVRPLQWYGS